MATWLEYLLSFAIALIASLSFTALVRAIARKVGLVAKPRADRWHKKPTALFGGVGVFAAFSLTLLVRGHAAHTNGTTLLGLCASGMFLVGLVDDRIQLKPYTKLVAQIVCATAFTLFGMRLHWLRNPLLDQALSIFWLVGVTNALNLLDNIDGAAGGIAAIAAGYYAYFFAASGEQAAAITSIIFAGSVVGFLVFNFHPASIFMGDCGSLFMGFVLGGLSLLTPTSGVRRNVLALLSIPVLLLLIPIVDTTLVTITRRMHGRSVSQGGRDHTSHRLVALGLSERAATLVLWALAAASGAIAMIVRAVSIALAVGLLAVFAMGVLFFMIFLGRVRVYEPVDADEDSSRTVVPTLAEFSYKRRVFEVLNDFVIIVLAYYCAFVLRFEGDPPPSLFTALRHTMPIVVMVQLASFLATGLYQGVWRYTGLDDLRTMIKAVFVAAVSTPLAVLFLFRFQGHSRAVFVIDAVLLMLGLSGSRLSFRLLRSWLGKWSAQEGKRVIIYGAGDAGELLLRELRNNRMLGLVPVGFVDDDPEKMGRLIHGVKVLGKSENLDRLLIDQRVDEVVLSTPNIQGDRWAKVVAVCTEQGRSTKKMRISIE